MRKHLVFPALFLVFLIYFVWNSSWHMPSQLVIKGQTASPVEVRVSWDSGSGFNDMETADLVFGKPLDANAGSGIGIVRIRRVGKSHPAAKSAEVWVKVHHCDKSFFRYYPGQGCPGAISSFYMGK